MRNVEEKKIQVYVMGQGGAGRDCGRRRDKVGREVE